RCTVIMVPFWIPSVPMTSWTRTTLPVTTKFGPLTRLMKNTPLQVLPPAACTLAGDAARRPTTAKPASHRALPNPRTNFDTAIAAPLPLPTPPAPAPLLDFPHRSLARGCCVAPPRSESSLAKRQASGRWPTNEHRLQPQPPSATCVPFNFH